VPQDGAARQHQGIKLPLRHVGQIQLAAHGTQAMAHQHKAICLHARLDQPQNAIDDHRWQPKMTKCDGRMMSCVMSFEPLQY